MSTRIEKVEQIQFILEKIRPFIQQDGGDIELVDVRDDGVVEVKLLGACSSCGLSDQTLKLGVEMAIKQEVEGVVEVINIGEEE